MLLGLLFQNGAGLNLDLDVADLLSLVLVVFLCVAHQVLEVVAVPHPLQFGQVVGDASHGLGTRLFLLLLNLRRKLSNLRKIDDLWMCRLLSGNIIISSNLRLVICWSSPRR